MSDLLDEKAAPGLHQGRPGSHDDANHITPAQIGKRPFIPAWLDDAGLSLAEFRVYLHLCRRADNRTGIAWPAYESMMETCGVSRKTVWAALKKLKERGLIVGLGKEFKGNARYRIASPIVSLGERIEDSNSFPTGTIEDCQSFPSGNSNRSPEETPIVSLGELEGSPLKVIQRRKSTYLAETIWKLTPPKGRERSSQQKLADALKKLPKDVSQETIVESLEAWTKSKDWMKEDGQFVPGIHKWVKDHKWLITPSADTSKTTTAATVNTGGRTSNIESAYE